MRSVNASVLFPVQKTRRHSHTLSALRFPEWKVSKTFTDILKQSVLQMTTAKFAKRMHIVKNYLKCCTIHLFLLSATTVTHCLLKMLSLQ